MSDTQRLPSIDLPPPEMCGQDIIAERYLSLLRICLTRSFREPAYGEIPPSSRTFSRPFDIQAIPHSTNSSPS